MLIQEKTLQKYYIFLKYTNDSCFFFFLLKIEYLHAHICINHQLVIHHIVWGTSTLWNHPKDPRHPHDKDCMLRLEQIHEKYIKYIQGKR